MAEPTPEAMSEQIVDGFIVVLGGYTTEQLHAIADHRDTVRSDGWLQRVIREYVDVWR